MKYLLFTVLICLSTAARPQTNVFAKVEADRTSVFMQQPFKVTFTVATTTWYTAPLKFNNLQVPDAFIVPYTRTIPGQFEINGRLLSGVQFYYMIFPCKAGSFSIPALEIIAESPADGTSTGRKITVHTSPLHFTVKPVPRDYPKDEAWLVAEKVIINDHWNTLQDTMKVGDVLEREVTVDAIGTLPQFIPEITLPGSSMAGVYPKNPMLKDTRDDERPNGERTEAATYLLLKSGEAELAGITVCWWNPYLGKLYKHSSPPRKIYIKDNPQLGILSTLQDSLAAAVPNVVKKDRGPRMLLGYPWYWLPVLVCMLLLLTGVLIKVTRYIYRRYRDWHVRYLQSERYWFRQFKKSGDAAPELIPGLYAWWSRFPFPERTPSAGPVPGGGNEWETFKRKVYREGDANPGIDVKAAFIRWRKKWLEQPPVNNRDNKVSGDQLPWP